MRWKRCLTFLSALLVFGCDNRPDYEPRSYPSAEKALAHWRSHEGDFRQLAAEWQQSGGRRFFPYPDSWWWDSTHARKIWWGIGPWRIAHLNASGLGTVSEEDHWSFEEAAQATGLPANVLAALLRDTEKVQVRSVEEVLTPAKHQCTRFDLKGGWMGRPYGFLHCPGAAEELRVEQVHGKWLCPAWVQEPAHEYRVMDVDWAYFEIAAGDAPDLR